jgi:hypothetical protein
VPLGRSWHRFARLPFAEERADAMTDLQVTLDFSCCGCEESVSVTVLCRGKAAGEPALGGVAAVNVPCPTCGEVNQVFFEPNGTLRCVRAYRQRLTLPVPSVN